MANITVKKGFVGATDVSWGTGTFTRQKSDGTYMNVNQIYAASIPIADLGTNYTSTNVEGALSESSTNVLNVSASVNALSASHTAANASQASTLVDLVKGWWKNAGFVDRTSPTRVVFPAGYYPIGNRIYSSENTIGWSTVRGALYDGVHSSTWNFGMDYGTLNVDMSAVDGCRLPNDWIYLYAVPPRVSASSTPAFIGSGTPPSGKYNNS
ncbi:MAG: hypothetical protein DRP42_05760, partial [Tenericutes bacterium]